MKRKENEARPVAQRRGFKGLGQWPMGNYPRALGNKELTEYSRGKATCSSPSGALRHLESGDQQIREKLKGLRFCI